MADILSLVAHLRAKPGMEQELVRTMTALVGPSRKEEGCIDYHLHQSNDDPAAIVVYENWCEMADLEKHFEEPYLKAFFVRKDELVEGEIDIKFYTMLSDRDG